MFRALLLLFERLVPKGDLHLIDPNGCTHAIGDRTGEPVVVRLGDPWVALDLVRDPELALGESYMDGRLIIERGSIYRLLELLLANVHWRQWPGWFKLIGHSRRVLKRLQQFNPESRAVRNARFHYDIERQFYDLFLDADRQYSCAYFEHPQQSLEQAQLAKKRHLASKLLPRDGDRILDVGCGWGGLALYLARTARVEVTGITLSDEQVRVCRERARKQGLAHAVRIQVADYRQVEDRFDRIVSVGMLEHVGIGHYRTFFRKIHDLLADDGIAVLHAIGRFEGPAVTNPFIARYVFPGGYIPALSEVVPAIERSGLLIADIEILRLHYAETLRHWRERFRASWDRAVAIKGEDFCRMWEFYLASAEAAFRYQDLMVFQIQLVRDQNVLPLTRDYMLELEQRMRMREQAIAEAPRLAGE